MSALICGSMAYDNIMVFKDYFKNHILPEQVHILNVSFLVPEMRKEFGGCAGNIAYNLKLLGGIPLPMATVGEDFHPYQQWLEQKGINTTHIKEVENTFTAQAFITTDLDDNQITAFHPGAMNASHLNQVGDADDIDIGIVSPDGRDGMLQHAQQFAEANIPFIFDPGQGLPMFDGDDLKRMIDLATWVAVNDYEANLIEYRTELSRAQIADRVEALIVTKGGEGSTIYAAVREIPVAAVQAEKVIDPTGCGDAYRAGLLYGLTNELDWPTIGSIATLMGSLKIAHPGTQNHKFSKQEFHDMFIEVFGYSF